MSITLRRGSVWVDRRVDATPDLVWSVLTDLEAWPRWGPSVSRAELDHLPEGADRLATGARGTVWTPVGLSLPFEITEVVPQMRWSWKVAGIRATVHTVEPEGDGTRVSMGAPVWAPGYAAVLAVALARIDRLVAAAPG